MPPGQGLGRRLLPNGPRQPLARCYGDPVGHSNACKQEPRRDWRLVAPVGCTQCWAASDDWLRVAPWMTNLAQQWLTLPAPPTNL